MPNVLVSMLLISILLFSAHRTFLIAVSLWKEDVNKKPAKFYTNEADRYDFENNSDDDYIDDGADEISMSTITDNEVRRRINQEKLNMTMTTVDENRAKSAVGDLFPLEKLINSEKEYILWNKVKLISVTMGVVVLSLT